MQNAETRWLDEREMRAWIGYRRMRLLLDLELGRDLMNASGLSEPDYDVLSNLSEAPGRSMRLSALAAHMHWSKSRLSHHITRMQQRGLVERQECADDGRGSAVVLTDTGWDSIVQAAPGHVESVRRHLIDLMTEEELDALAAFSRRVIEKLESDS
ncbi:MarR family winged helix-turn-helix transcriptional regulator [Nonomuraea sp. NPDC050536]|uniref:MarR family winged helix-turn-helix transcriptional regulator n=1 Tax=Nonomuraea sp. NPDC050536 TaxID=3364366 RepID=UPI0037C7C64C